MEFIQRVTSNRPHPSAHFEDNIDGSSHISSVFVRFFLYSIFIYIYICEFIDIFININIDRYKCISNRGQSEEKRKYICIYT